MIPTTIVSFILRALLFAVNFILDAFFPQSVVLLGERDVLPSLQAQVFTDLLLEAVPAQSWID